MKNKLVGIAEHFISAGANLYYVGGCCRDWILGKEPEDIDICVVGFNSPKDTHTVLYHLKSKDIITSFNLVYGRFPVWNVVIDGEVYQFAMARKETKEGDFRTEFLVEVEGVTIEEDLYRRDFTVNAIARDVITGSYVDPYNGIADIFAEWLRPVSEAFKEDELRVIRGARFAARFNLKPTTNFYTYAAELDGNKISNERVGIELMKVLKTADNPSIFFKVLKSIGWLQYHFKELNDTIGVPQSPIHHPEGDVFTHTMHCIDIAEGWFMRTVMLCHDLGKATHTTVNGVPYHLWLTNFRPQGLPTEVKIQSIGHEEAGISLTKNMLNRISFSNHRTVDKVALLVELHMVRNILSKKIVRKTLRRLMSIGLTWNDLVLTCTYDVCGRPPRPCVKPDMMEAFAEELVTSGAMIPIVTGKLLVGLGVTDMIEMGIIIRKALELQDRGSITKENWFKVLKGVGYNSLTQINPDYGKHTKEIGNE